MDRPGKDSLTAIYLIVRSAIWLLLILRLILLLMLLRLMLYALHK